MSLQQGAASRNDASLPQGWEMRYDPDRRRMFYIDHNTKTPKTSGKLQEIAEHSRRIRDLNRKVLSLSQSQLPKSQLQKQFLELNELITREMLRLDGIDSGGNKEIRNARKAIIQEAQKVAKQLDDVKVAIQS
eukprot:gene10329-2470_t